MKNTFLIFLCTVSVLTSAEAQVEEFKHCGTDEILHQEFLNNPSLQHEVEYLQQRSWEEGRQNMADNRVLPSPYIIPVVFHVVHDHGTENITDAQILDAVAVLNIDFRKLNSDTSQIVAPFGPLAADCDIEFRLAQIDPNGNCTNGIDRIQSMETYVGDNGCKMNQWPRNKYLNVWVVRTIASGAAGYAYYPSSVNNANDAYKDGIVILHSYIGRIGTGNVQTSRALTHEIGHYLALPHVWGSTNNPGVACGDDGIQDTPETKGWTTCNLTNNDICNPGTDENVQNYMEYAYCQRMFTWGQAIAMHYALNSAVSGRNNLWSNANLAATGCLNVQPLCAPHADFDATRTMVCDGGGLTLLDNSWSSDATSWSWVITGPDTFFSTVQNPALGPLTETGSYTVSLTATNSAGSSTITRPDYFYVSPANAMLNHLYSEGFEDPNFMYYGYMINNRGNNANNFFRTPGASHSGNACLMLNNYGTTTRGDIDELITPSYHLDFSTGIQVQFSYAHATACLDDDDNEEVLKVYSSIDCGQTWTLRWTRYGSALCSAGYNGNFFVPNDTSLWETVTVNIPFTAAAPNVRFKFEYSATNDNCGNNFYLDDINILTTNVGVEEGQSEDQLFSIYPNPTNGSSDLTFSLSQPAQVTTELFDLSGRLVSAVYCGTLAQGPHTLPLNGDKQPLAAGSYFVRMTIGDKVSTQIVVINAE